MKMAVKFMAGNRIVGLSTDRQAYGVSTSTTFGSSDDSTEGVQSSKRAGNRFNPGGLYAGAKVTSASLWLRIHDDNDGSVGCRMYSYGATTDSGTTLLATSPDTYADMTGTPTEKVFTFPSGTEIPLEGAFILASRAYGSGESRPDYHPAYVSRDATVSNSSVDWYNYYSSENLQVGDIARMTLVHQPLVVNYTDQPTGTIFEETDTGKHYILDSSDAWNEIV